MEPYMHMYRSEIVPQGVKFPRTIYAGGFQPGTEAMFVLGLKSVDIFSLDDLAVVLWVRVDPLHRLAQQ